MLPLRPLPILLAALAGLPRPAQAQLPAVHERKLPNGARLLLVERPGSRAFHARLMFRGGTAEFPEVSRTAFAEIARAVFLHLDPGEGRPAPEVEALLHRISAAATDLRQAALRQGRIGLQDALESDLTALMESQTGRLRDLLPRGPDPLAERGCAGRTVAVEADYLDTALDIPADALEAWAGLEAGRLSTLRMARFPLDLPSKGEPRPDARWDTLLGAALPGHPYGRGGQADPLSPLPWTEARDLARRALSPDRMVLVAVGDLRAEAALPVLEKAFGSLAGPGSPAREGPPEGPEPPGPRRLSAAAEGPPRLQVGWRIPPADHPDTPTLALLAAALGPHPASLLHRALVVTGLASDLQVAFGVPGERGTRLLAVEARPEPGHNLQELALAVEGEVLRLQQDPLGGEAVRRLQLASEVAQVSLQTDPDTLARALGRAALATGDWRSAFSRPSPQGPDAEALQRVARTYFVPSRRTEAFLESDPLEAQQDALERQWAMTLLALAKARGLEGPPAEEVVRQALRQLRMIPREDRQALLLRLAPGGRP